MSGFKLYTNSHKRIWDFLHKEIERHKRTRKPEAPRDVMDVYLNVLESSDTHPESFSEDQLLATCMDMFMAGSETTSNTLSFCFLYLILNPEVQVKAQKEVDAVVGKDRMPSLDDRPNLPYVECVVMESLRMFGGRAFTVPHRALRDTSLSGYHIPKSGDCVVTSIHSSLTNPGTQIRITVLSLHIALPRFVSVSFRLGLLEAVYSSLLRNLHIDSFKKIPNSLESSSLRVIHFQPNLPYPGKDLLFLGSPILTTNPIFSRLGSKA
ncbi:unnamed protein product [Phaedon cochleariae]|uniref:Cytochrome P450 n=1 Tax=Phaedon cochleariae TaxID=80249 RepID=A0A9N9SIX3_PHACE|nr:unnamed protein product [Phaedon cochleariae]